jgi:hypothetical protein
MTHPARPPACDQQAFAAALLDPALPCPPGVCAWNGSDPTRRLAVHRNTVLSTLVEALAATFPVVQQVAGTERFRTLASVYVRQHPPRSPMLAQHGAGFAAFIAGFEPAATLPHLPDLARLEFARLQALHAADAAPIAEATLAAMLAAPGTLPAMRLELHASVAVIASPHAVVSLWAAFQADDDLAAVAIGKAEQALVLRDGLEVLVVPVDAATACFVCCTLAGDAFGGAAAAASSVDTGFDLAAALALLLRHHVLVAMGDRDLACRMRR